MTQQRESMEVDVLFVGAGPASLSSAYHLTRLVEKHNSEAEAAGSTPLDPPFIAMVEKGAAPGAHSLSGAVVNPVAFHELIPRERWDDIPWEAPVKGEEVLWLGEKSALALPWVPPEMHNHGCYVACLGKLVRWLAELTSAAGVEIFPGFAAVEPIIEDGAVRGIATGERGRGKDGEPKGAYDPGIELRAKVTALGEGEGTFAFDETRREKGFFLHVGTMRQGRLEVGDRILCSLDRERRRATARNHSATHLLHHALRRVLGQHATQSGSAVSAEKLRFDFSNPTELSPDELREVEDIVNERILADEPIVSTRMGLSEAREIGATALFGEKYGDIVRVVSIGDFSRELCGGTHCERTGEIGLLRILSEASVAGGVRRIEALTGLAVLERLRDREELVRRVCGILSTQEGNLLRRSEELLGEMRSMQKRLQQARQEAVRQMASGSLLDQAEQIAGASVVLARLPGGPAELRSAADVLRKSNRNFACLLASDQGGKVALVAGLSADLVEKGLSAVDIVRAASEVVGGGGGGRPDLAQAGGRDPDRLEEAFAAARRFLTEKLSAP